MQTSRPSSSVSQEKKRKISICVHVRNGGPESPSCGGQESRVLIKELTELLVKKNLTDITVAESRCMGLCENGCMMYIEPDDVRYQNVKLSDLNEIVSSHLMQGQVVKRLRFV